MATRQVELIGVRIANIRPMTKKEQTAEGWFSPATVIELENGVKLYASRDDEGNDAGVLFGSQGTNRFAM